MMKRMILVCAAALACAAYAYLPPVEDRCGIKVEIGSFPQKTERTGSNPYGWPLGVTEVAAGAPRAFPVVLENRSDKSVTGALEVWMNDDWEVKGPQGEIVLAPKEKKELSYVGTAKPTALNALYPVHARFTPKGAKPEEAPHPIAVFMFRNPNAPRPLKSKTAPVLAKGVYRLDVGFPRTSFVEVKGQVRQIDAGGRDKETAGQLLKGRPSAAGVGKNGFSSHPPYRTGAGFIWSDFPLDLPAVTPISFSCANFLVDNGDQPPSDGVEYRVYAVAAGQEPKLVCSQLVTQKTTWQEMAGDLTPWAGKQIALRLWTGPGPKMNTCCDGGGWGDVRLRIGLQPERTDEAGWKTRETLALDAAKKARAGGSCAARPSDGVAAGYRLETASGDVYGAGVVFGPRGLIDGVLAFTDGSRVVTYRGFTARTETEDGSLLDPQATVRAEKGTLRISWSLPGRPRGADGFPRISELGVGPASEKPFRVYAGFGNVVEEPKKFTLHASGFGLSTRHVAADYANGLSVLQAVDVPPDYLFCDGANGHFALCAHHDATFTFVPSSKGAFEAGRRFRAVSGYRKSPGRDLLGSRMCLDQWSGDYAKAAKDLEQAAKYGLVDAVFVKHDWQAWGYDYRLPEIWPPRGDAKAFCDMRDACRRNGMLFCPHDNYTDIYPDCDNYSYDLVVFNLDGTPQKAWFNPGRHAQSYRWAPHAFRPWCLRNAKLLRDGCDPDAVFIDVLTAHGPFDYLDRQGRFHDKMETSYRWGEAYQTYREGYRRPDAVCISEAGQDHLVGVLDAGQSDHFTAEKLLGAANFADAERTPWHDIATHNYFVLFAGGLGHRYSEPAWNKGGDQELNGYASDDYFSTTVIGGRNPMCHGPFSRDTVKTYWLQHDVCAELGRAEFLDLRYEGSIHRQHAFFSDGGEVWINRATNDTWTLPNGLELPPYGHFAKTRTATAGVISWNGVRCAYAKAGDTAFYDARKPSATAVQAVVARTVGSETKGRNRVAVKVAWETVRPVAGYRTFVHLCAPDMEREGIVFQALLNATDEMWAKPGKYEAAMDIVVPDHVKPGRYLVRYGAYSPKGGGRLTLGGAPADGGQRLKGGTLVVAAADGKVSSVVWEPEAADARVARDRLLGVNRAGIAVDFGGVKTDGSFRLVRGTKAWTLTPLPGSDGFSATFDLAAFGMDPARVVGVESVEPGDGAAAPSWKIDGTRLAFACDAKAFAYRLNFR